MMRHNAIFREDHPHYRFNTQLCKVCKKTPIRQDSIFGICQKNPECKRAYMREAYTRKLKRHNGAQAQC